MTPRKLFIAGASGVVGKAVVAAADAQQVPRVAHYRPSPRAPPPKEQSAVLDLADPTRVTLAMRGCTTVLQLIGTMRHRFAQGDTYETSDIGTTQWLLVAAKDARVDHFVLLSSIGAGRPVGAYLKAKARAETLVRESGIPFTLFRPSAFQGEGRNPPPGFGLVTRTLGLRRYEPIRVETLARALLACALRRGPLGVALEGEPLLALAE
jgi:uncharacterized protein YbjT (DUF2867 family)